MWNFTELEERQLKKLGANLFKEFTGQNCLVACVYPQECTPHWYWFRVGQLYMMFVQDAVTTETVIHLTDENGKYIL